MTFIPENGEMPVSSPSFETRTLHPRIAQVFVPVSNAMLKRGIDTDVSTTVEWLRDLTMFKFTKIVYSDRLAEETLRFHESPVYKSPQHAFLASLPEGSFRRRWLAYWWGINPTEPLATKRVHEVKVERWATLPDAGLYPEPFGPVYYQQITTPMEYWQ